MGIKSGPGNNLKENFVNLILTCLPPSQLKLVLGYLSNLPFYELSSSLHAHYTVLRHFLRLAMWNVCAYKMIWSICIVKSTYALQIGWAGSCFAVKLALFQILPQGGHEWQSPSSHIMQFSYGKFS